MLKKWLVGIAIFAGVIVALLSVGVVVGWSASGFSESLARSESEFKIWQGNSLPSTKEDLFLTAPPSNHDNAAPIYTMAIETLDTFADKSIPFELTSKESWESGRLEAYVNARRLVIDRAIEASEKPACRFDRDWDLGAVMRLPEFAGMKAMTKLLCYDAQFKAKRGDAIGAAKNLRAARRIGMHASSDPNIIGLLVAVAIDAIVCNAAAACAGDIAGDGAGLDRLREAITSARWDPNLTQCFRGEAYMSLASMRNLSDHDLIEVLRGHSGDDGDDELPPEALTRSGLPRDRLPRAVEAELMRFWNEFYPQIANPKTDKSAVLKDMQNRSDAYSSSHSLPQAVASIMLPYYDNIPKTLARRSTQERTALAFIGVLKFKSIVNRWPKSLSEAGVDGVDELGRQPIQYSYSANGARVWNVGRNGFDDGGRTSKEAADAKLGPAYDDVFVFPWPN